MGELVMILLPALSWNEVDHNVAIEHIGVATKG